MLTVEDRHCVGLVQSDALVNGCRGVAIFFLTVLLTLGCFVTIPGALADAKDLRCFEKTESEAKDGCTDITTSLARYATRAAV